MKISDVKKGLKEEHSLTQAQVNSNLTYLIDKGWIARESVEKTFNTGKTNIPSTTDWYEITASGIDKIDGDSEYQDAGRYGGIRIDATGQNIITLGDGNVVNARHQELHERLDALKSTIVESSLVESEKLDAVIDIETLKDQLLKANPDQTIVQHVWTRLEQLATVGGAAAVIQQITPLITGLLG